MLDELFIRGGPVLYVLFFITLLIFYILIDKYNFLLLNSKDWLNNQLSKFKEEFPPNSSGFDKYVSNDWPIGDCVWNDRSF